MERELKQGPRNRGAQTREQVPAVTFPSADAIVRERLERRPEGAVDILLVNPPAPDGGIWIRCQHRVGRRSREGMIWSQVSLAQLAALFPDYRVEVVDAIAERMGWPAFEALLRKRQPRYYVTHVTGPTLQNDLYGCFLARSLGATTVAFGTHVTPKPLETMRAYPVLDYVLRGEPELTLRELVDVLDWKLEVGSWRLGAGSWRLEVGNRGLEAESQKLEVGSWKLEHPWDGLEMGFRRRLEKLFMETDPEWQPRQLPTSNPQHIKGLVWRNNGSITINPDLSLIHI